MIKAELVASVAESANITNTHEMNFTTKHESKDGNGSEPSPGEHGENNERW